MRSKWKQRKNVAMTATKLLANARASEYRQRDVDVGSAQAEDTIQSPRDRFRTESFLVIIDQLQAALKQRLDAYNEIDKK